ncbi:MAG: hypothetical protein K8S54_13115 [Spirochaetia bacterium]|nr:hypothetical protein [Spirochaetia bacterium]
MVPQRKLIAGIPFVALALTLATCNEKKLDERGLSQSPEKITAGFELLPAAQPERLSFKSDGTVQLDSMSGTKRGLYNLNQKSLRFRLEDGSYGVFLRETYNPLEWRGFFQDETRILKRTDGAKNL